MTIGALRVKNEARWIQRVLRSIWPVCHKIVVFDDHSTDDTRQIAHDEGAVVIESPFQGVEERRDKDYLLDQIWKGGAQLNDWVLMVDGDEMLCQEDIPALLKVTASKSLVAANFHIVYLWDREDQIRIDRWYAEFRRPSLFRLTQRKLSFMHTAFGGGFHCFSIPQQLIGSDATAPVRLLHYGYLNREDRIAKYHWYNKIDPNDETEDRYRHMVIGDVFPADSVFKWAGPLELQAFKIPTDPPDFVIEIPPILPPRPREYKGLYDPKRGIFEPPEMAECLEHGRCVVDGSVVRLPWFIDTEAGVVKQYGEPEELNGKVEIVLR